MTASGADGKNFFEKLMDRPRRFWHIDISSKGHEGIIYA